MREIKFRAWDDELKTMFYSSTEQFDDSLLFRFEHFEIEKPVYMQYTGLKDKNFKEIYEGDIVNVNHYGGTPKYETVRFYTIAGFAGIHPFTDSGHHWASHRCEIVGNIYENPELLEGEK